MKPVHIFLSLFLSTGLLLGCGPSEKQEMAATATQVVDLTIEGLTIQGPDDIPSGWTTFRVTNNSSMTHFVLLDKMPDGKNVDDHKIIAGVFQEGMDLLSAGKPDDAMTAFGKLPEWFGQVVFSGGPGLVGPGQTFETTVYLEPAVYVAECYVKTNGVFHSFNPNEGQYGMVHQMVASGTDSGNQPPEATIQITLSSERGIEAPNDIAAGDHIVSVFFEDQTVHEHFIGHDVHLVKLDQDTDVEALLTWMNWTLVGGLQTPAPALFLGGTNEMPAGSTAYFTASLEPGRYAWISEVPNAAAKGMFVEFEVR